MSRPKPTVLLTISNKETYKQEEVLAAEGIWAVFYDGKPINKTDEEWKAELEPFQYYVMREQGTERAFSVPPHP